MSVRKREWITPKGEQKSAWVVDYVDTKGKRWLKTFEKKKEADALSATAPLRPHRAGALHREAIRGKHRHDPNLKGNAKWTRRGANR